MSDKPTLEEALKNDPFYDPNDTLLDLSEGPKHLMTEEVSDPGPELTPEVVTNVDLPEPIVVAPQPEPEPEPQAYEYEDGSSVTIEKTRKGWKATLDSNTGAAPEVFYGASKDEMFVNLAAGKINATRKIREMNRRSKLESVPTPVVPQEAPRTRNRELSADDVFTIKSQFEDNPAQAFDTIIQKKYGRTLDELVDSAERGDRANFELTRQSEGNTFVASHPDYYKCGENYWSLVKWLAKFKLGQVLTAKNEVALLDTLVSRGLYTADSLAEAFEDLRESGLILFAPGPEVEEEEEEPVPTPKPTAKPAADTVVRARPKGIGIRNPGTEPRKAEVPKEEGRLEDLPPERVEALLKDIRKLRMENPAEYARLKAQGDARRRL